MGAEDSFGLIAKVAVDKALYSFDNLFDYLVPDSLKEEIGVGKRVVVPFGKGGKKQIGLVFSLEERNYDSSKIKQIASVIDDGIVLDDEMLYLVSWLKENTFCTYFDAVRTVLPTGMSLNINEQYRFAEQFPQVTLTHDEDELITFLKTAKSAKEFNFYLDSSGNPKKKKTIDSLVEKGILKKTESAKRRIGDETEQMVRIAEGAEELDKYKSMTPKQKAVVETLEESHSASIKEICYLCGVTSVVVKNLVKAGILEQYDFEISRAVSANAEATDDINNLIFSPAQQKVFDGLSELMDKPEPKCALLRGVTGSGKTSVFLKLIDKALEQGKTAIMLVPEISLTPQTVGNFQRLFGNKVAIIHSNLSIGQRTDECKRIKNGEARIVIGTRSAIFAPVKNIGIIVIDEEGEHTYKSEKAPRYHARNVAKQRCFRHNAFLLLASATPSLDSYYNAQKGRYSLFELNERYSKAVLPEVFLINMKAEAEYGNRGNFSEPLLHEMKLNLERGEQTILLLNRRGYHTYANCVACGAVIECPNCNIPLTYHKINESVICHYCGFTEKMPEKCPKCGSPFIHQSGTGTQRIEDEISAYFPEARVLRIDADTTMTKNSFETKFAQFGSGEYDIMVGTQMIAKGLDFENVTLVGVLLIDKSLYAGDYLGYEKTFSLITQVVGRSGRGSKKGRAYLQTFTPDHYVLQLAAQQNYPEFYRQEIEVRKELLFPPFCDLCLVGFSSLVERSCEAASMKFLRLFMDEAKHEQTKLPLVALGPTKSGTGRLGGKFRYKLIIKCKNGKAFRSVMNRTIMKCYKDSDFYNVSFYVDINGEII